MNAKEIIKRSNKNLTNKFTGMDTEKVSGAIQNKFQFNIENTSGRIIKMALIPAYFNTMGVIASPPTYNFPELDVAITSEDVSAVTAVDFTGETTTTSVIKSISAIVVTPNGALSPSKGALSPRTRTAGGFSVNYWNPAALIAAGYPVDFVLDDAEIFSQEIGEEGEDELLFKMEAANPTKKIHDFLSFIKTNPIKLTGMTIVSDDKSVFATDMEVAKVNPFKRNPEDLIDMNKFFSKYQTQNDRINIDFSENPLELCDDLLWTINVPDKVKMSITLRF